MLTGWKCKMVYKWRPLAYVKWEAKCQHCGELIKVGQSAWWLQTIGLMHQNCGVGTSTFKLSSIYVEDPSYDKNPFGHIHEHKQSYYDAKEWRDSLDN